jgi:DNA-directed RNA polymerase specialized sigma subunit
MTDDKRSTSPIKTAESVHERDTRIFKLRQAGTSIGEIARRFGVSTQTVSRSISRQLEKMNREALLAYPEILRMELERLDSMQQALWPLTQHRRQVMDDGTEIQVEPDIKAVQQVLAIMDRRSKLLGMEQTNVNIQMDAQVNGTNTIRATIAGQPGVEKPATGFDAESEAKKLLEIMAIAGVLPEKTIKALMSPGGEIIDAEIVSEQDESDENDTE